MGENKNIARELELEAKSEDEARDKAISKWEKDIEVDPDLVQVELLEERSGFLGMGSKDNLYRISLDNNEANTEEIEKKLEYMEEDLAVDGDFEINFTKDGIMLQLIPPRGEGDWPGYYDIRERVEELGLKEVDWQVVQELLDELDEEEEQEPVKIAPRLPELDQDASVEIDISNDKMKVTLDYEPARGGEEITVEEIEKKLKEEGIVHGIKSDKLEEIAGSKKEIRGTVVAEGDKPEPGEDASLNYLCEIEKENIGTEREDGSINFFDRDLITNVEPGEVLVSREPPVEGEPGKTVTGEVVEPEKPKDVNLPAGKNVRVEDDNLIAAEEGQVVKKRNKISVSPVYKVQGDLNLDVGNVDFVGSVVIAGDVQEGFQVKAEDDIEVKGKVFAADLEAGGGIKINNGFIGKGKGSIKAGGDVEIKFIENGEVESGGSLIVGDAIMHSRVSAAEKIILKESGKGLIVGGRSRAGKGIEAGVIGSSLATDTRVEVGIDPGLKEKLDELEGKLEKNKQNLTKTKKALNMLEKLKEQKGELPQDKRMMELRLKKTEKDLEESRQEMEERQEELKKRAGENRRGKIKVRKKVHPGVNISVGNSSSFVKDTQDRTSFVEEEGEVRQKPL
ncbi:DUF342 domain-containing protein [Halarsenatibacter silvermanii]|uniref:RNA-binding protein KhpB N-terminal domain-containing protein n=1 Tax=Halarsenatibacter silvermanii TaxID=321763 RepID=A0A1G9MKF7_9FIRM|nr:FapA family protein [Halarsenatibacter silvermanii]SDL74563.1 hypothetical protein SAMN04488692_10892 [Halarsenatibacter silvermanii]